jgi:hypothetical protein
MKLPRKSYCTGLLLLSLACCPASPSLGQQPAAESPAVAAPAQPDLAAELLRRMDEDQVARQLFIDHSKTSQGKQPEEIEKERAAISEKVQAVDQRNQLWLSEQIKQFGWPGKSLVGEQAAHAAWLLVQHADANPDFQEKCLELMKAAATGEVTPIDIAYLIDRVLIARGQPQVYGTQCEEVDGRFQPKVCLEPEALDQRRKEVGLQPIKEYLKVMEEVYHGRDTQSARDK